MGASQSSTKQRNSVLSRLDPNNKPGFSEGDFVDDGVSPKNELHRSSIRIYASESGIYEPV